VKSKTTSNSVKKPRYIVGIDEAGRGPLAGPVAIGVALIPSNFDWNLIPGVGDSKKVSEKNREVIFHRAKELKQKGLLDFAVVLVSAKIIDTKGVTFAVASGITKGLKKIDVDPNTVEVRLDGLLKAPEEYIHQKTIIHGDALEKSIGLASIMAKVTRDHYMVRIAKKYPLYNFHVHKGYGTLMHRNLIKKHRLSPVHRRSFTRKIASS